jgi:hypothetical protein
MSFGLNFHSTAGTVSDSTCQFFIYVIRTRLGSEGYMLLRCGLHGSHGIWMAAYSIGRPSPSDCAHRRYDGPEASKIGLLV